MSDACPNILILMTDQQRADHLACGGHPVIDTPHTERLAAEGMRFSHCCTNSPVCMPARASFISGLYPHNHNMWCNSGSLPEDEESLFRRLQQAGYRTAHIGKSHYYSHGLQPPGDRERQHLCDYEPYLRARGFDDIHETTGPWATVNTDSYMTEHWQKLGLLEDFRQDYRKRRAHDGVAVWPSPLPEEEFPDSYVGRTAKEYLQNYSEAEPFCLFVGFGGPHEPWDAPDKYAEMYEPQAMPEAIEPAEPRDWLPDEIAEFHENALNNPLDSETISCLRANYAGKITLIDFWFGEILSVLDERNWTEDTIVVFWSDHGEMAGDHGRLHKSVFFESALRVPLLFRWPDHIPAGTVQDSLTCTVDIPATLLQLAGVDRGDRSQGKSMVEALKDPATEHRCEVLSEIASGPPGAYAVRTKQWKYVIDAEGRGAFLYNLIDDPEETVNLIGHPDYSDAEAELRDRLFRMVVRTQPRM